VLQLVAQLAEQEGFSLFSPKVRREEAFFLDVLVASLP
jgi:hypothetical protein